MPKIILLTGNITPVRSAWPIIVAFNLLLAICSLLPDVWEAGKIAIDVLYGTREESQGEHARLLQLRLSSASQGAWQ